MAEINTNTFLRAIEKGDRERKEREAEGKPQQTRPTLRDAVRKSMGTETAEEEQDVEKVSTRVAERLKRAGWPEREIEIKRERARESVRREARGG